MLRRLAAFAVLLVLLASIPCHEIEATTVRPVRTICPVCKHDFVFMAIGSYTHFGSRERDFSDMPFALFGDAKSCPHCLFTGIGWGFESGAPVLLEPLRALPKGLDPARVAALKQPRDERALKLLIAEACLRWRDANLKDQVDVQMHLYFSSKRSKDLARIGAERARLLDILGKALASADVDRRDEATYTYLRGELLRVNGLRNEALLQFNKAKTLISKLPPTTPDESLEWLSKWADEQSRRIAFAELSVKQLAELIEKGDVDRKVALITLAGRADAEAWRAIATYVMPQSERLIELDDEVSLTRENMKIDGELWRWAAQLYAAAKEAGKKGKTPLEMERFRNRFSHLFSDSRNTWNPSSEHAAELARELKRIAPDFIAAYQVEAGDTLSQISQRYGMPDFRMEELNPQIANKDQIRVGQSLKRLVFPAGWDEKQVLRHLPLAIQSGEPAAVAFFLRWAQTIGPRGLNEFDYEMRSIFDVLPNAPGLDAALKIPEVKGGTEQLIRLTLRQIAGDAAAAGEIVELLRTHTFAPLGFTEEHWNLASRALVVSKHSALKMELFERMQRKTAGDARWRPELAFAETIQELGTADDVARLEAMIQELPLKEKYDLGDETIYSRERIEGVMRSLKLRLLAEACGK